ncbi:MAG: hypothetical protein HZB33_14050 [Nitrospirae bacterium]|nr:hypothetical protein [Nitrospirota bacterium]
MRLVLYLVAIVLIGYVASKLTNLLFRRGPSTPDTAGVLQPAKMELDIIVGDSDKAGMPVITIKSNAATLNVRSVEQLTGDYIVTARKQADNVAVIEIEKKQNPDGGL